MATKSLNKKLEELTSEKLIKWVALIATIATSVLAGAFFLYWSFFNQKEISTSPSDWGPFGDFIGGITNPIISFFSLMVLLLTLILQSKQLDATREELKQAHNAAREQTEHLQKEARKTDVYRTLQVLEARLESLYREPVFIPTKEGMEKWELYLLFSHATPSVLSVVPPLHELGPQQHRNEYLSTKATLTQLHVTLVKLAMQLSLLVSIDNSDEFTFFYEPTLSHFAKKLAEVGYLPPEDEETIRMSQVYRRGIREARQKYAPN